MNARLRVYEVTEEVSKDRGGGHRASYGHDLCWTKPLRGSSRLGSLAGDRRAARVSVRVGSGGALAFSAPARSGRRELRNAAQELGARVCRAELARDL
jgi:hypothetical protein